jgi:excisionase family DNA binding protein
MAKAPDVLSTLEAAALLGLSKRTLHRRIAKGLIPATKLAGISGSYVISRAAVDKILADRASAS